MPFKKYEAPAKPEKAIPDVKVGKLGISLNKSAAEKFGLADASFVNLWFDEDTNGVAISPSTADDKSAFKATPRGKTKDSIFIAAGKFYGAFKIALDEKAITSSLVNVQGMAAFELPGGKAAATPKAPYTGKPRGRKKSADG